MQSGKTLETSLEMAEKSSIGRSFLVPSSSKSRSSLFRCFICSDWAVPPQRYRFLMASICETASKTGIVSCLSPNFQSWLSISFQVFVGFLDVEKHGCQKPVDNAVVVALRNQTLTPHLLYLPHGIEFAEFVQIFKLKIKQGFFDEQTVIYAVRIFGIRPQATRLLQLSPKDSFFAFNLSVSVLVIAHSAAKLGKKPENLFQL